MWKRLVWKRLMHEPNHDDWDKSPNYSPIRSMPYQYPPPPAGEECSACHRPKTEIYATPWDCTLRELENAASQNRCIQCQPIYELIKLFVPDGFHDNNKIRIDQSWECILRIRSGMRAREDPYVLDIFRLHGENRLHLCATINMLKREFSEPNLTNCDILKKVPIKSIRLVNTGSEETLQWIKKWIEECDSKHSLCTPTRHSAQLHRPKRILDLRFGTVRLLDDHQEEYSYACLSHCVRLPVLSPPSLVCTLLANFF
jgi:hypothetical protein